MAGLIFLIPIALAFFTLVFLDVVFDFRLNIVRPFTRLRFNMVSCVVVSLITPPLIALFYWTDFGVISTPIVLVLTVYAINYLDSKPSEQTQVFEGRESNSKLPYRTPSAVLAGDAQRTKKRGKMMKRGRARRRR